MTLIPGTEQSGLRFLRRLGAGAMGEVWEAEQLDLRRRVAVKRIALHLAQDPLHLARFEREAQAIARVNSPHVVCVYSLQRHEHEHLLVMELIPGGCTLRRAIGTPVDWLLATSVIHQIAKGLAIVHDAGVIHRDVKPDNILLTPDGIAKIADFGLSRFLDGSQLTHSSSTLGTPAYMAPEVWHGNSANAASDLYSLGATWYHLITGVPPIPGGTIAELAINHLRHTPESLHTLFSEIPQSIANLVHACLAKQPELRPSSAHALVNDLLALTTQGIHLHHTVPQLVRTSQHESISQRFELNQDNQSVISMSLQLDADEKIASSPSVMPCVVESKLAQTPITPHIKAKPLHLYSYVIMVMAIVLLFTITGTLLFTRPATTSAPSAPLATPESDHTQRLQSVLDLARENRWLDARIAVEIYQRTADNGVQQRQASAIRYRFEAAARMRVEHALTSALTLAGENRHAEARILLEQAQEPAVSCGLSERIASELSKLPPP